MRKELEREAEALAEALRKKRAQLEKMELPKSNKKVKLEK